MLDDLVSDLELCSRRRNNCRSCPGFTRRACRRWYDLVVGTGWLTRMITARREFYYIRRGYAPAWLVLAGRRGEKGEGASNHRASTAPTSQGGCASVCPPPVQNGKRAARRRDER